VSLYTLVRHPSVDVHGVCCAVSASEAVVMCADAVWELSGLPVLLISAAGLALH
jgi:hypothetical protein